MSYQDVGDRYGTHRVVHPIGVLPQQAEVLNNTLPIFETELLIEVESLNIDSSSFHQIKESQQNNPEKIKDYICELVRKRGKHHNPVTGSGGMLIGQVKETGPRFFEGRRTTDLKPGDRIASLVSLTLTPLEIYKIKKLNLDADRVDIEGHAILFQSGVYSKLPTDISETEALAVLDVCGAPAHTEKICSLNQTVVIIGGAGKSGILSAYIAKKKVGKNGKVICLDYSEKALSHCRNFSFIDEAQSCDARKAVQVYELVHKLTQGKMADVVINVANVPDTEMSCVLSAKPKGLVYFFSTATNFTKAALGSEGIGADVQLMIGNGYCPGHAELTLQILRDSPEIRKFYQVKYGSP